ENVHILGHNGEWEVKTITRNNQTVQFVGWSFPRQYVPESPLVNFTSQGLDPNFPAIGIFHGDAFSREKKYGPFDLNNLLNKDVDAWIIGHIHKPTILHGQNPFVCYPGSPHALSPKETGLHSPLMLTVSGKHKMEVKPVIFSPVRYENISVNITGAKNEDSFRDIITSSLRDHARAITTELEKVRFLIYDIKLEGRHRDVNVLSRWAANVPDYRPDVESATIVLPRKVINNAEPSVENLHELASQPSPAGIVAGTILALREGRSSELLESLRERWYSEREKLVNAVTYQPLSLNDADNGTLHEEADRYILRECNRLLNEFINQQAN
ncbi:MAG TPA: hypothetical protein VE870_14850, partial [Bacteroidales bacterium]|nr:hypothetical protein [Bacteroidales bacterium]